MKKLSGFVLLTVLLLFITGCKKEKIVDLSSIEGLWELRQVSGMFLTTYPPGNGNTIRFAGNNYEMSSNGQITQTGQYKIIEDLTAESETCLVIAPGQYTNRIIYDNNTGRKIFIQISGNKLTFLSGCFAVDAGSSQEYVR